MKELGRVISDNPPKCWKFETIVTSYIEEEMLPLLAFLVVQSSIAHTIWHVITLIYNRNHSDHNKWWLHVAYNQKFNAAHKCISCPPQNRHGCQEYQKNKRKSSTKYKSTLSVIGRDRKWWKPEDCVAWCAPKPFWRHQCVKLGRHRETCRAAERQGAPSGSRSWLEPSMGPPSPPSLHQTQRPSPPPPWESCCTHRKP